MLVECLGLAVQMAAVHKQNAETLETIIDQYGWPGKTLVGDDGAEAAWLVLQHAIACPELQRMCLPLLQSGVETGEVPAVQVAYLEDRSCVFEGRPQRYGTQFDWDGNGQLSPHSLQDPERVDAYRESVGLGPLSERVTQARQRAEAEGEKQPLDVDRRQKEREAWARKVGWR